VPLPRSDGLSPRRQFPVALVIAVTRTSEELKVFVVKYTVVVSYLSETPEHRRLKRHLPTDLITRF
jgi:hypothetical protein